MARFLGAALICALVPGCYAQQPMPENAKSGASFPLVHVEHLIGDQYNGFTQSCLLVDNGGKYHREVRAQKHPFGHATANWGSSKVFEGLLDSSDRQRLTQILESERFGSAAGIIGDFEDISMRLGVSRDGVFPRSDMEIFAASVSHTKGTQVIEVIGDHPETKDAVQPLKNWVASVEKKKASTLGGEVSFCASSSAAGGANWQPITRLRPIPSYAPEPAFPVTEQNAKLADTITVHAAINPDGSVGQVTIRRGKNPALDQLALAAVKKWKFAPLLIYGFAIPAPVMVEVRFHKN